MNNGLCSRYLPHNLCIYRIFPVDVAFKQFKRMILTILYSGIAMISRSDNKNDFNGAIAH